MYLADCEFIPAGNQPLTLWGQRAGLSSGLLLTWDKSPPARTAGVRWGWREGWRKAAQGSPVTEGTHTKITIILLKVELPCFCYFPSSQKKSVVATFSACVLYSVSAGADVVVVSVSVCQWYAVEQWKLGLQLKYVLCSSRVVCFQSRWGCMLCSTDLQEKSMLVQVDKSCNNQLWKADTALLNILWKSNTVFKWD